MQRRHCSGRRKSVAEAAMDIEQKQALPPRCTLGSACHRPSKGIANGAKLICLEVLRRDQATSKAHTNERCRAL